MILIRALWLDSIPPHFIFEALAYIVGFLLYRILRARSGDPIAAADRSTVMVAAVLGAAAGSKLLYWLEDPYATIAAFSQVSGSAPVQGYAYLMGGKTIVGGLLGGTLAVEWIKRRLGITSRTGDLFAIPLAIGIAIGRIGCYLAGLDDHTYGVATSMPWGVDFGDGITRHPTQLYEIGAMLALALFLYGMSGRYGRLQQGDQFRTFLISYLGFRLVADAIKPGVFFLGFTAIQWACLLGLIYYGRDAVRIWRDMQETSREKVPVALHE